MASRLLGLLVGVAALGSGPAPRRMPEPRYGAREQLLRPSGYREWMFVSASLGMSYSEGPSGREPEFHNIYLQPEARRQFLQTGRFPDKTMLVMEKFAAGSNASISRQGHFEDRPLGIEVAVKDEARFPEKWAYFSFIGSRGEPLDQARPFPKEACWNCHHEHGAADNVFVQFYPLLKRN